MQQRATKLILAGVSTLAVGIGAFSTLSAVNDSHADKLSLGKADKAAAILDLSKQSPATKTPDQTANVAAKAAAAKPAAPAAKAAPAKPAPAKPAAPQVLLSGSTLGSYFWDTGHSGNGDTGAPASGLPMQEGCFASPSWPLMTKGWVEYQGKRHDFFICDRGPGQPSHDGVMLDIDGITYSKLTGGKWAEPDVIGGSGQAGHISVTYHVTKWGPGPGKGAPQPLG